MKTIGDYMMASPFTVNHDLTVEQALDRMRANRLRHLPVLRRGELVGILSERDINLVYSLPGGPKTKVEEVMTERPYAVPLDTPFADVLREMARNRYGAALVLEDDGKVLGIFTAVDALMILEEAVREGRFR